MVILTTRVSQTWHVYPLFEPWGWTRHCRFAYCSCCMGVQAGRGRSIIRRWTLFALALTFAGCNDTQKQKSLAIAASQRFQQLYNAGACQQIYDDASAYFQRHETRSRWLKDCDEVRKRFGSWIAFTPGSNNSWPFGSVGIVWVRGAARFENGAAEVRLDWDLGNDRPALNNVLIQAGGEQISIPGFTGEVRD
jgi:hypothetical protein